MSLEKKLIDSLKEELVLSEDKVEVITFGYRLFVYSLLGYFYIVLLAYILGTVPATLTAAITASVFRIFSGGVHASSQKRCVIIGTIIFNLLGLIATVCYNYISWQLLRWFSWIVFLVALITFILYAPADTPGKPITTKIQKNRLKRISVILLIIWIILSSFVFKGEINIDRLYFLASIFGLAWQSVSLWPITYKAYTKKNRGNNL